MFIFVIKITLQNLNPRNEGGQHLIKKILLSTDCLQITKSSPSPTCSPFPHSLLLQLSLSLSHTITHPIMVPSRRCCLLALCLLSALAAASSSDEARYVRSLLKFKQSLTSAAALDGWREPAVSRLCSWNTPLWTGCLCANGSFIGLRLDNMSLAGAIDVDALADLPIYTLSVAGNNFSGQLPDLRKLPKLRSLYLTNNGFDGEIGGDAFAGMKAVRKVVLAGNRFTGRIPASLAELPRLVNLQAQGNLFEGRIPEFWQRNLTVNLSNNRLRGAVPVGLSNQNASSFYGEFLCKLHIIFYLYIFHFQFFCPALI